MMFKRCVKGAAKALGTACQITFLMAGLSGCLVSAQKEKDKWGEETILFPVIAQSRLSLSFLKYVAFPGFSFKVLFLSPGLI